MVRFREDIKERVIGNVRKIVGGYVEAIFGEEVRSLFGVWASREARARFV